MKHLDKMVTTVAREIRVLEQKIKATNAVTPILDYAPDESVMGDVQ